jgi:hypothetical protein
MAVEQPRNHNLDEQRTNPDQSSNTGLDLDRGQTTPGQTPQVEGDDGATKYKPEVTGELLPRLELLLNEGAARARELNDPQALIDAIYASLDMIEELPPDVQGLMYDAVNKRVRTMIENGELLPQQLESLLDEGAARARKLNDPQELIRTIYALFGMIEELPEQGLMWDKVNKRVRTMIENGDLGDNLKLLPQQLESLLDEGAARARKLNDPQELIRAMHRSLEMIKGLPPDVQGLMQDIIDAKISTMRNNGVIDNKLIEQIEGINEEQIEGIIGQNTDNNL